MAAQVSYPTKNPGAGVFLNAWRLFIALWYLGGSLVHLKLALTDTRVYEAFGKSALFAMTGQLWTSLIMPNITLFALLLAVFEMTTGILILSRGKYVKIGLAASVLFSLFLVQLGLGFDAAPGSGSDFLHNRFPNLLFAILNLPLFRVPFARSFPALVRARLHC